MELCFTYTNHKGQTELRRVKPLALTYYDIPSNVSEHLANYPPGFFLIAHDLDRNAERSFYLGLDLDQRLRVGTGEDGWPLMIGDLELIQAAVQGLQDHALTVGKKETSPVLSAMAAKYLHFGAADLFIALGIDAEVASPGMMTERAAELVTAIRALAGSVLSQDETPT